MLDTVRASAHDTGINRSTKGNEMTAPKRITINGKAYTKVGIAHRCADGEDRPLYRDDSYPVGVIGGTACPVADCTRFDRTGAEAERDLIESEKAVRAAFGI
jgi:hypothetical protein